MGHDAEAIVVGAGPAGATAAMVLARAGVDTLLLEKRRFPRDKLCGGFLADRSLVLMDELHGSALPPDLYHHTDDRFQIWHGGRLMADRRLGGRMAFAQRLELDHFLADQARAAGAMFEEEAEVVGADQEPDHVSVRLKDGSHRRGRWLIGADGALSRLRRQQEPGFLPGVTALEVHRPWEGESVPRIDFGLFPWGYGWSFPKRGCVTVGLGGLPDRTGPQRDLLRDYLDRLGLKAGPAAGWPLPVRPARRITNGRLLLAGDAAGFCEPITGEGIYYALRSGQRAAQAVLAARLTADPSATRNLRSNYLTGTAHIRRQIRASLLFRHIFYAPRVQRRLLEIFCSLPDLGLIEWSDVFRHTLTGIWRAPKA